MAKLHKKEAAARARAAKKLKTLISAPSTGLASVLSSNTASASVQLLPVDNLNEAENEVEVVDSDSEFEECGYEGGVNCVWSDTEDLEYQLGSEEEVSDVDDDLAEMDEDELPPIVVPNIFLVPTSAMDWENAEKKRSLGYTGTSTRTRQRHAKEAREREKVRNEAKISCVNFCFICDCLSVEIIDKTTEQTHKFLLCERCLNPSQESCRVNHWHWDL